MGDSIEGRGLVLREETSADVEAIAAIHRAAFAEPGEAEMVEALRAGGVLMLRPRGGADLR